MADQPTEARLALYRKLSTEHLQTLLRSDLDGPPLDEATVDSILTVLAERRRTPADTSAAWQDFSAYYSTPDSPGAPVRRTRAHLQKAYTRLRIPIRVVSAAAAMFILIFALFPRVETGASDAPNAYITWTDEYLKIDALPHAGWSLPQGGEYHTDNAGLQQLHDALAAYGVTGVVPSWVPEGAVLAEYDFGGEFAGTTSFYACFSLPDGTGFDFCREVRRISGVPILFLTASDEEMDIITGLDLGGDDYITKPFKLGVLLSRVHALLRRAGGFGAQQATELCSGGIRVDLLAGRAEKNGVPLELTAAEYKLLCLFLRSPGQVLTKETILNALWDCEGNYVDTNTLTVYIRRLRLKVEDDPGSPQRLVTVRGMGYRWNGDV